jgi:hypothetical protein
LATSLSGDDDELDGELGSSSSPTNGHPETYPLDASTAANSSAALGIGLGGDSNGPTLGTILSVAGGAGALAFLAKPGLGLDFARSLPFGILLLLELGSIGVSPYFWHTWA